MHSGLRSRATLALKGLQHRQAVARARKVLQLTELGRTEPGQVEIPRPVHFFGNERFPAFKLNAVYLAEGLRRIGVRAQSDQRVAPEDLRDSILVFVKSRIPEDLARLKRQGNRIVIDMRDNFNLPHGAFDPDFVGRDVADVLIFPNRAVQARFLSLGPTSSTCMVLYGFADPAITAFFRKHPHKAHDTLRCCYFGQPDHLDGELRRTLANHPLVSCIAATQRGFDRQIRALGDFNLHLDWRPGDAGHAFKPLTKLLVAAECRANIVITNAPRVFELLPDDYPFAADAGDFASVLANAENGFGGREWKRALAAMERIRIEYSFENHVERFSQMLQRIS